VLEQARARLLAEPDGAARLAELAADDARTRERLSAAAVAREVQRRRAPAPPRRLAVAFAAAVPALGALLLWVLARPVTPPDDEGTRIKGLQPQLLVHRKTPDGADPLTDGAQVHPGDVLQLSYVAAGRAYGAVVSIDAAGVVTLHLPEHEGPALRLTGSGAHVLPHAYALDDAPGWERFFLVTSDQPFDASRVLDAARALGAARKQPLGLPAFLSQTSFTVEKRAP
jgi:hypothetical protein